MVGGGVIGLTCALRLAGAGHRVTVLSADPVRATTSAVAAAVWFPYRALPVSSVARWGAATYDVLAGLASAGVPGVWMRPGTVVVRSAAADLWWESVVPGSTRVTVPGARFGVRCTVPVVDMGVYLPWLAWRCRAAGVTVVASTVSSLASVPGSTVVLAAGLRSGPFVDDVTLSPVRGQVVRLANPGLTDWFLDDDDPAGMTYVVPRGSDVVCGGTADDGAWSLEPSPAVAASILSRARALVPALQDAPVVSSAVGLRPGRPSVRLDRVPVSGRPVISCYGHGGAGVTLSWGCAADVVALV